MPYFSREDNRQVTLYYDILPANAIVTPSPPPILLIHGFAGTPESDFAQQLPRLRERQTLLLPHLYGYGKSTQRTTYSPLYYREDAKDLLTLLDLLQLFQVQVVAFSDGGIVGLLLAALYPQRVRALAVLGAQSYVQASDIAAIRHWLLERPLAPEWQQELARLHGEPYWRGLPEMYVNAQETLLETGGELISPQELSQIACPTLIMHGERDRVVSVAYAHQLHAQIPGSRLHLFAAGHAAHLRCSEEYTGLLLDFLHTNQ